MTSFIMLFLQDWSLKYDHENPVQPRFDLNAPDLYIPTMAYITYVVLAGFVLGKKIVLNITQIFRICRQ